MWEKQHRLPPHCRSKSRYIILGYLLCSLCSEPDESCSRKWMRKSRYCSRQSRSSLNYNRLEIICLRLWSVYDTVQPAQFSDWMVKGSEVYLQSHATFRVWLSLSLDQDNMRVRRDTGSRGEVWLTMCVTTTETGKACLASIYNACTSVVL